MKKEKDYLLLLLKNNGINITAGRMVFFENFLKEEKNLEALQTIINNQDWIMNKWKLNNKIDEMIQKPIKILNATVGKPFETKFDFEKFGWEGISAYEFIGLEDTGLVYDQKTKQLTGIPVKSGDIKITFRFKIEGQAEDASFNDKMFTIIINPDPKSLWKNLPSDSADPYTKEDNVTQFSKLGSKHIAVSCKRGRSHANVGSFREDDFAFNELSNGWSIVVISDGAGSAKVSRQGSHLACQGIVEFFKSSESKQNLERFDDLVELHNNQRGEETNKRIKTFLYNNLGQAAFQTHKKLEAFADQAGLTLKDLSATLIFTLFKKFESGYVFLSFGVGDCPMAVLNKGLTEVTLLNWIDVGDYGGGTRFITMPEIFKDEKFETRLNFHQAKDFSYLILMSDGIYDAKFVVESSLADIKKWQQFMHDLNGINEDKIKVEISIDNKNLEKQLSDWMDFWSVGNHDDRTLAIVF